MILANPACPGADLQSQFQLGGYFSHSLILLILFWETNSPKLLVLKFRFFSVVIVTCLRTNQSHNTVSLHDGFKIKDNKIGLDVNGVVCLLVDFNGRGYATKVFSSMHYADEGDI